MAAPLDTEGRLAEGRPALGSLQEYVWAVHLLGYQHPDLTTHAAQLSDWYGGEDGLDLRALDGDCAALASALAATERALLLQDGQLSSPGAGWQGRGAIAARDFLRRHGDASERSAAAVRAAADALGALRDSLTQIVDRKVAAVVAIDARRAAERPEWLAAARIVATGAGDRAAASELLDQRVKPFVDNDIRVDFLTAMSSSLAAVRAAYDTATAQLRAESGVAFDVPGDLGPPAGDGGTARTPSGWTPRGTVGAGPGVDSVPAGAWSRWAQAMPSVAPADAAATVPAAAQPSQVGLPPGSPSPGLPSAGLPSAGLMPGDLAGASAAPPALGDLGRRLVEGLGGLTTQPAGGGLPGGALEVPELRGEDLDLDDDPPAADDAGKDRSDSDEEDTDDETGDDENRDDENRDDEEPGEETTAGPTAGQGVDPAVGTGVDDPRDPAATAVPTSPPIEPLTAPGAPAQTKTPCEIAADELPQAGR